MITGGVKMQNNRHCAKSILIIAGFVFSFILLIAASFLVEYEVINTTCAVAVLVASIILLCVFIYLLTKYDYETSIYICKKCHHSFKPSFKAYFWGAHTLKTRYLKCPQCQKKSMCAKCCQVKNDNNPKS